MIESSFSPLSRHIYERLTESGVSKWVLCSGSRNAELWVYVASQRGPDALEHYDERSAAFYALGLVRALNEPVAVLCTSGTAVANMLPACVEAYYAHLPLVIVSADRPRHFLGSGAPQAIDQRHIFGKHAEYCELGENEELRTDWQPNARGPTHVNLFCNEPFKGAARETSTQESVGRSLLRNPLILVGRIRDSATRVGVATTLAARPDLAVIAEPLSGLRSHLYHALQLPEACFSLQKFDCLIRIGEVPVSRVWRDLEDVAKRVFVCSEDGDWTGLSRTVSSLSFDELSSFIEAIPVSDYAHALAHANKTFLDQVDDWVKAYPRAEQSFVSALSRCIPPESFVYLGNSLPIREFHHYAKDRETRFVYGANRGVNGIDGQISSFLGEAHGLGVQEAWAVLGDLTTLYDFSGLWAAKGSPCSIRIVVLNNQGGEVFRLLPYFEREVVAQNLEQRFCTRHVHSFDSFAKFWGFHYTRCESAQELSGVTVTKGPELIEAVIDREQSDLWRRVERSVCSPLGLRN